MPTDGTNQAILIAAKGLFIRKGFNDTTMSDIARASGKGRRTLYMYYECKADVFKAVVNLEFEKILVQLEAITEKPNLSPEQKVYEFIFERYRLLQKSVYSNGTLKSFFFRDIWNVEHYRKDYNKREKQILVKIITEGIDKGMFNVHDVRLTAEVFQFCMRGFEVPFIQGRIRPISTDNLEYRYEIKKLVCGALGIEKKHPK